MDTFYLVQGDTGPQLKVTLTREDDGLPVDLSEATSVVFRFRRAGTETVLTTLSSVASTADAQNGIALFLWNEGDLDLEPGRYEAEIEVVLSGNRETVYETLQFLLREDF